mgnify:CR=1 FL=1
MLEIDGTIEKDVALLQKESTSLKDLQHRESRVNNISAELSKIEKGVSSLEFSIDKTKLQRDKLQVFCCLNIFIL